MKNLLSLLLGLLVFSSALGQSVPRIDQSADFGKANTVSYPIKGKYRWQIKTDGSVQVIDYLGNPVPPSTLFPTLTGSGSSTNVSGLTQAVANNLYKPIGYVPTWAEIQGQLAATRVSGLAAVSTSGNFNDLFNRPTDLGAFTNNAGYQKATDVTTAIGNVTTPISNSLTAFRSSYDAFVLATNTAIGNRILSSDPRLTDARTPLQHAHSADQVTSGVFARERIASGTPAAGRYPDGATGAWTPLPVFGDMYKSTYDADGNSVVDNATNLGGSPASAYVKTTDASTTNSRTPTGAAGGFLSGSYPNPGVNESVLGSMFNAGPGLAYNATTRTYSYTGASGGGTVAAHTHQSIHIVDFAAAVNTQVLALMQSWPNWAPGRILGTDPAGQPIWLTPTYSGTVTGGSSSTGTTGSNGNLTPYDSVLARIDSSAGRINVALMTVDSVRTAAELRSRLTSTQTNKDIVLTRNFADDDGEYVATGAFTNVRIRGVMVNNKKLVLKRTSYSTKWIWNNGSTRKQVELADLDFKSDYTGGTTAAPANPIVWSTELVPWDGYCMRNVGVRGKAGAGVYNGLNFQQASGQSGGGAVAKNIYWVNVVVDSIPRSNEMLCQVYDQDRVSNFVVAYSYFGHTGQSAGSFGSNFSVSGRFVGMFFYRNRFSEAVGPQLELVNGSNIITRQNTITSFVSQADGIGMSDDARLLTKNIWHEDNTVNVTKRPWYNLQTRGINFTGGTYIGRQGVQMNTKNGTFKNFSVTVYDKTTFGVAFDLNAGSTGNLFKDCFISNANGIANGAVAVKEVLTVRDGATGNTFDNVDTTIGKQANGTWLNDGSIQFATQVAPSTGLNTLISNPHRQAAN